MPESIASVLGIHDKIVEDVPALKRGKVWCRTCGAERDVDASHCLRNGWPKCCGHTMSIDPPTIEEPRDV